MRNQITLIGYFGWYGSMAEWIASAYTNIGWEVIKVDRKSLKFIPKESSYYMFIDCSEDYSAEIPSDLKGIKIFWSMDSHMPGGLERSINIARKCDIVFSSNYEHGLVPLSKFGINSYLMPITYTKSLVQQVQNPMAIDFALIGHPNSYDRIKLFSMLSKYKSFTGKADNEDTYLRVMSSTKYVVNQPTEPWDIILNNRFFEALAYRKILFQKKLKTDLIERLGFVAGKDFVYWESLEQLSQMLEYAKTGVYDEVGLNTPIENFSIENQLLSIHNIIRTKFYDRE